MTSYGIRQPRSAEDLDAVRQLCWDYRDLLLSLPARTRDVVQLFYPEDKYSAMLADLEKHHARPDGIILMAEQDGKPLACGMSRRLTNSASEIKRLYVAPDARGTGQGRALCQSLIDQARDDGFKTIFLDTSKDLQAACTLYASMGFRERGPYQPVPAAAKDPLRFFEMQL